MPIEKKVSFNAGGQEFVLLMNFAALCAVEKELDDSLQRIIASMQSGAARLMTIVTLFRASLLKERPQITHEEAMNLIEEIGPERAAKLVAEAIEASPLFKVGNKVPKAKAA